MTWMALVGVAAAGSTLTRPSGTGWNAGAVSSLSSVSGDVCVDYAVTSAADYVMFGPGHGDSDQSYADLDFAIYTCPSTGRLSVYENGTSRGVLGNYAAGDRLRVCVEGGQVRYYRNHEALHEHRGAGLPAPRRHQPVFHGRDRLRRQDRRREPAVATST